MNLFKKKKYIYYFLFNLILFNCVLNKVYTDVEKNSK